MTTHTGNGGVVKVGAVQVAEVLDSALTESIVTVPDTAQGDAWASHQSGTKSFSGSVNAMWDPSDSTGQEALTLGASVVLHLMLDGVSTGDIDFNGTVTITGIERSSAQDTIVPVAFTFEGNGALTRSVLA